MTRDAFLPDHQLDEPVNLDADPLCDVANCREPLNCAACRCCHVHCPCRDDDEAMREEDEVANG